MKLIKSVSSSRLTNSIVLSAKSKSKPKKQTSAGPVTFAELYDEVSFEISDLTAKQKTIKNLEATDKKLVKAGFVQTKMSKDKVIWELKGVPTPKLMLAIGKLLAVFDSKAEKIPTLVDINAKNNYNSQPYDLEAGYSIEIGVGMSMKNKLYVEVSF